MSIGDIAAITAAGLAGGFVNAIAGGGSLILFPALIAIGLGTVPANVTNSVALWPGYLGNVGALGGTVRAELIRNRRRVLTLLGVAAVGAGLGSVLLLVTPSRAFEVVVPFLVVAATLLLAFGPRIKQRLGHAVTRDRVLYPTCLVGAVYGGYFGGGLGVILLAVLGLAYAASMAAQNSVKAVLQLLMSSVSVVVFAVAGPVHWPVALVVAPAALIGGVAGGRLTRVVSETWLRRLVVVFGLAVGAWLAFRAVGPR